ncbi:MAG TPA: cobyric acid synthase [Methanomassiliicoccales archaeon]|nr:cobyric acid synthase [Methanomassiliicoccales archaeon]
MDFARKVREEVKGGIAGPNRTCEYYPCHFEGQDCTFCFCPLYPCMDTELGKMVIGRKGDPVWSCMECHFTHRGEVATDLKARLEHEPMVPASPERNHEILAEMSKNHRKRARSIMVLGATSGAGKSLITTALCRIFSDRGLKVAPFKSQNMSLNSCVTRAGEEIARAQELQARAARAEPSALMNPILLKPKGNATSQVIVDGRPYADLDVSTYYDEFVQNEGMRAVRDAYDELARDNDVIVIEGAGSPAEINLGAKDISNMVTAEIADAQCILVVNMEWGGAFAYACGTIMLLPEEQRKRICGIVFNNLQGSADGLRAGIIKLERLVKIPVLGIVPHLNLTLPTEDSMHMMAICPDQGAVRVGMIRLPHVSNFTDLEALAIEPGTEVVLVSEPSQLSQVDALVIPGTKNTMEDLEWLRASGLFDGIRAMRGKVPIIGICGGYQMLGREVIDETGVEGGVPKVLEGLGLLDVVTRFSAYEKRTVQVDGTLLSTGEEIRGYEIHMGRTEGTMRALLSLREGGIEHNEGAVSEDGMVIGTYVHGIFDLPPVRKKLLSLARKEWHRGAAEVAYQEVVEKSIDQLAAGVARSLDLKSLIEHAEGT